MHGNPRSSRLANRSTGWPESEGEEPEPMMHGREESDSAIVAMTLANKTRRGVAERVAPRPKAEGIAGQSGEGAKLPLTGE